MPHAIQIKSLLNKTKRRDPWFLDDYTINPYSGCSFNCLYCYIRGSKYGYHMEEKLSVKINALDVLEKQLYNRAKKKQYGIIVLSSATDPYLQFEKDQLLTRNILEVILKYKFPVHVITKSDLVTRDFDLLQKINEAAILPVDLQNRLLKKVFITFSFSTLDNSIAGIFEPGATRPTQRLAAMRDALNTQFHSGVSLMPLLPYISDTSASFEHMFSEFRKINIKYIFCAGLGLFGSGLSDSKTLVMRAVEKNYPQLLPKYQRFFTNSHSMPEYYSKALDMKLAELCNKFGLKTSILDSFDGSSEKT